MEVLTKKKRIVFNPIRPNFLGSPSPAVPNTIEMKTIGTTSIVIRLMNIFPTGLNKYVSKDGNQSGANRFNKIPVKAPNTKAIIILIDKFIDVSFFLELEITTH